MTEKIIALLINLLLIISLPAKDIFSQQFRAVRMNNLNISLSTHSFDKSDQITGLSSTLNQLFRLYQQNGDFRSFAEQRRLRLEGETVVVTIFPADGGTIDIINEQLLSQPGVVIQAKAEHSMRVAIPIAQLQMVATTVKGIGIIDRLVRPVPDDIISEGVGLMKADTWQSDGYKGDGVKVAVIDGGFENLTKAVNNGEIPSDYVGVDYTGDGLESETEHGTAVAEAVIDVAPNVGLYLYHVGDVTDLENAKDDAIANGIAVINHSMGWFLQSYYDGTGLVNDIANDANDNGIVWCNSAGNSAEDHYRAVFDNTGENFHNFKGSNLNILGPEPGKIRLFSAGYVISVMMNWNDYPSTAQDYDLLLCKWNYSTEVWEIVAVSTYKQTGSEPPIEAIAWHNTEDDGIYAVAVYKYSATTAVDFTIFASDGLSYHHVESSIADPASAAGVVTVGAIARDFYESGPIEDFSSQGPTTDGRPKPEVTAPDKCNSFTYGPWPGTSLSSPHTAGVCALIKSIFPGCTNAQIKNYLFTECTVDLGDPGRDNVYGYGKVVLPKPYPATIAVNTSYAYPTHEKAPDFKGTDYKIVGFPGAGNLPLDSVLTGVHNEDWQAYWDNGAAENNFVGFNHSDDFRLKTGRAFWVIARGELKMNFTASTAPLNNSLQVEIALHPGWNLITNPLPTARTWAAVQNANNITDPIYTYNAGFSVATNFEPYCGCYFFNMKNLPLLKVPYVTSSATLPKATARDNWRVHIRLQSGEASDETMSFGLSPESNAGLDRLDFRKPQAIGDQAGVYFHRPDWDDAYSHFATDIRPTMSDAETWKFKVNSIPWQESVLTFSGIENIPEELDAYLFDNTNLQHQDLSKNATYRFTPKTRVTDFSIVVGEQEIIEEKLKSLIPQSFALSSNYPNPFNSETAFRLDIPTSSDISFIIYDLLGKKVRTIYSGVLEPVRHWFKWNGRDDLGRSLASGLYFYRLIVSGNVQFTGKMILIK